MKTHSTKQLLVLFLILIIILLGLHYVAFSFIRKASQTVSALQGEVNTLQTQIHEFSKYSADDMRTLTQAISRHIVSKTDFVTFIENIEAQARSQNIVIEIRSVDVEKRSEDEADDKELMRLQIETRGSWSSTMKFLNHLEYLPYQITVHEVSFSTGSKEEGGKVGPTEWQGRIELTALKFK